ncbi:hypothetical protein [Kitasatospora sp. NPDC058478]|uniref:hypothetical protein n=1 Tax=unclassified Kitasatospora TaxID=2633591 RepID=UPI0036657124
MTETGWMVDSKWRGIDLTRAYLTKDRVQVAASLEGLDTERRQLVLVLLGLSYDDLLGDLGKPPMNVRDLYEVAALAPAESEFATTAAVRRVAAKEAGFVEAMTDLELVDQIHVFAICTVVMLVDSLGHAGAQARLDEEAASCERLGYLRPYMLI